MNETILDQSHDIAGREIHRLTSLYPQPEFVKKAFEQPDRVCGDPEMELHLYADPQRRLYPAHTAAATWMSTAFFAEKRAQFDSSRAALIEDRLDKAANFFQIKHLTDALKLQIVAQVDDELTKLADEDFAIVWRDENGAVERHWPLRNALETQFASAHYEKHRDDFVFADKQKMASRILEKAVQYGADLEGRTEMLEKAAGTGGCSARDAAGILAQRYWLVKQANPQLGEEILKLAEVIRAAPDQARGHEQLCKLAAVIDGIDRASNLIQLYAKGELERPEDTLFRITEKVASDFATAHVSTTTGNLYELDVLEKLSVESVRDWMGGDFAGAVSDGLFVDGAKLAKIVPTLDRGAAKMFDRLMESQGLSPYAKEKTAAGIGADLYKLAAEHKPIIDHGPAFALASVL